MAFECGICTSMYNAGQRIPLLLECGHTFCQSCVQHNLGAQRCCPYCRHPIQKHVDDLPRNYALENAMEAANLPLVELMDRWGLSNAERMMVKPDHLTLDNLMSRKGYTGEVWKGTLWGKPVAVKLLPLLDVDERQLECLRREVAVLLHTTGECKQVCIYKGFCVKGGNFAIIMKLYSYSLANRVSKAPGRRLPLPVALKYSIDIVKGLVELHRLGVIAADMKPDNVLIDEELGDAVIADFGISSVVTTTIGNTGRGSAMRSSGAMRGTPNYMAPEQFAPGCRATNKVDIWGFAATLLHMITGAPPWHHDTLMQICTAVGVAKQAPPLPDGLPAPLQALLRTCFDADPAHRPTAVYLLKALQAMGPVLAQHMAAVTSGSSQQATQQQQQQHVLYPDVPAAQSGKGQGSGGVADDKQAGVDQYLAQLGLYSRQEAVSSGGGGLPSAPPLPNNSSGSNAVESRSGLAGSSSTACLGQRSSSNGGSNSSSRQKLPRVLWSEAEALQEERAAHQQQQHRQQASTAVPGCAGGMHDVGISSAQQKQPWAPHHTRSASEQVTGLSSRAYQQQQLQQQLVQPQEVAGAAHWQQQQQQQSHHGRSRSEVVPGWGASAPEVAANAGYLLHSRGVRDTDSLLPTHYEAAAQDKPHVNADSSGMQAAAVQAAATAGSSEAVGTTATGQVKRQRQQWHTAAATNTPQPNAALAGCGDQEEVPGYAAAADDAAAYSKWAAGAGPAGGDNGVSCSPRTAGHDARQHWPGQQQQHGVGAEAGPGDASKAWQQQQQPWWETPFDASSRHNPSPEPAAAGTPGLKALCTPGTPEQQSLVDHAGSTAHSIQKRGAPPPLLVHAHADGAAGTCSGPAGGPLQHTSSSNGSSTASLSRAASADMSLTGRLDSGRCPSACSRSSSARRAPRTLSNLLLGRATNRAALPHDLAAADSASSSGSLYAAAVTAGRSASSPRGGAAAAVSYPASLAKIRMAFGPASPERVPRGGAFGSGSSGCLAVGSGSGSSILSAAACAGAAAVVVGGGAAAAASGASAVALCGGSGTAAAAAGLGGAALAAGAAGLAPAAAVAAAAAGTTAAAVASAGVMAAVASRFTKGSKSNKSSSRDKLQAAGSVTPRSAGANAVQAGGVPTSPAAAAAAASRSCKSNSSSPEKPSRWRALFGSPSRRRPPAQGGLGKQCSVLDTAGIHSSSSCPDRIYNTSSSCNSSPAGYDARQPSAADAAHHGLTSPSAASLHSHSLGSPGPRAPLSPCKSAAAANAGDSSAQGGAAQAAGGGPGCPVSVAAAEAARASGSCSPLKAHARNLSLPSKLMVLGSTEPSPAASPNPVASGSSSPTATHRQQQQQQPDAAAGPSSPSRLGHTPAGAGGSSNGSSRGSSGGGAARAPPAAGDAAGSSSGSHSQVLAEALQQEVLARNLSQGGRHAEAEAALRNSLGMLSKQLGPGHPNTVAATTRLALHLNRNSKHTEAEGLLRQVLTHKQAMLGRKHPQVAAASINLAACLYSQGHYNAAARLYGTALEVRRGALGDSHADTAACINNLALCHSRLCEWSQAEQLFREALSARVAALGQLHPDVAITAHQLGHCLGQLGQHSEALVYHKQGLWVRQQQERRGNNTPQQQDSSSSTINTDGSGGSGSSRGSSSGGSSSNPAEDLVASHRCVALCLARLGCDSQAEEHLAQVLQMRGNQLAALHPPPPPGSHTAGTLGGRSHHSRNASTVSATGAAAGGSGKLDDVDWGVLADGDSRLSKQQADALLAVAAAAEELGRCLSRQGKHGEAEEQYWRALETRSQVLGSRHDLVMATEEQLRHCLEQQC